MEASEVVESFCETIYNMAMEGDVVIGARLAEKFRVAPPTVTETLKRMMRDGLVDMDGKRQVTLTPRGVDLAESVLRRHRLTERFLVDMLGMPWHEVHEEACRLEHRISGTVEERVVAALGHPTTCPHGNPIPGYVPNARGYLTDSGAFRLPQAEPGREVTILCVSEVVEDEEELIRYLHDRGLTPGTRLSLIKASGETYDGSVELAVGSERVRLSPHAAHALWVVPCGG
ncbi:MAG TPA: metal-dependent transcriptional regulator [Ktedonobacterales bacterium]|nr:metal-dependent transcriptional regulator [Ktedonobacterales bacterium]